jgi:hypothetical protein
MRNLKARDYFSEFMTRRWDEGLAPFIEKITSLLAENSEEIVIDMSDVKFLSVSFYDEIFRRLHQKGLASKNFYRIKFSPPLDPLYVEHLENLKKLLIP